MLRDDGLSYMAYTAQITFSLFLKMADEQTNPPYNKPLIVPASAKAAHRHPPEPFPLSSVVPKVTGVRRQESSGTLIHANQH